MSICVAHTPPSSIRLGRVEEGPRHDSIYEHGDVFNCGPPCERVRKVSQSVRDHRLAVARECRASRCSALLAQHGDYLAFGPPRLLLPASLRLADTGPCSAVAREYRRSLGAILDIGQECVPLFASLIGNHILSAEALAPFHKHLVPTAFSNEKPLLRDVILAVAAFVRSLPDLSDLRAIAERVFKDHSKVTEPGP
uniref:Constitutive coactivator of PPAR-gamma-like protein 1 homolog n=1 Tax=Petromyzon marinus TaxID=7757 RepID=A0AAJ7XDC8_PETMA|nr:constitutive coactivator of PPAR-gamma-like protein 1 homolog [Petromyzon marinus]